GVDLADGLNAELNKKHLPVRIVCVTNSSISTMVLSQFRFQHTSVALVLNHGINAAYYESANKIPKITDRALTQIPSCIAINTELAAYGKNSQVLKPTMWDNRINRESDNPQEHIFEKMVADKYLGEIPFSFFTSYMTIMEDSSESLDEVGTLLSASFNVQASKVDRCIVSALCSIVSRRAARLMGAATAALVK
ncbi:actin-like ATPase domain-containing protein, partial [Linderina pennispora]